MIHFSISILLELLFGLFLWWTAIYLLTQNPFSRIAQLVFGILATLSFYFSTDLLLFVLKETHQFSMYSVVLKAFSWCLYLPIAFLVHASILLIAPEKRKLWHTASLYFAYLFAIALTVIEDTTNLIRNYSAFNSVSFTGSLDQTTGNSFWLLGAFILIALFLTALNFRSLASGQKKCSPDWYKFSIPFYGIILSILLSPIVLLGYYRILPYSPLSSIVDLLLIVAPLAYSIIRYNLFLDELKIIFGKNYLYSSIVIAIVVLVFLSVIAIFSMPLTSFHSVVLVFALLYLIVASHPVYNWTATFVNDLVYNASSGFSLVNDDEVYQAIKNFNCPEKLEDSSLLRLKATNRKINGDDRSSVDLLRQLLKDSVNYFKPEEESSRRLKKNLKYQILKMIAFDQAEEGQILWELGFEEYPVAIMTRETRDRKPLFRTESPSDYYYISRNAYLALKKEAIHDVTWRISYLEKLSK